MEGRRVNSGPAKKTNPLYILFLCLVAAVFILLIVAIVLGARLRSAQKSAGVAAKEIEALKETNAKLEEELERAAVLPNQSTTDDENKNNNDTPAIPLPNNNGGAGNGGGTGTGTGTGTGGSWLDLSGHNEVSVQPTTLLDKYYTYYANANVNLRSGPGTGYDRITTVESGTAVDVAARQGNWAFARVGSRYGWISSDYLSSTQPSAQPTTGREATGGSLRR